MLRLTARPTGYTGLDQRIVRYLTTHPGPAHYATIARDLHHPGALSIQNRCSVLARADVLRWVSPGVYTLSNQGELAMPTGLPNVNATPKPLDPVKKDYTKFPPQPHQAEAPFVQQVRQQIVLMEADIARRDTQIKELTQQCADIRTQKQHLAAYLASTDHKDAADA